MTEGVTVIGVGGRQVSGSVEQYTLTVYCPAIGREERGGRRGKRDIWRIDEPSREDMTGIVTLQGMLKVLLSRMRFAGGGILLY